jgi:hypothetical protein
MRALSIPTFAGAAKKQRQRQSETAAGALLVLRV